MNDISNHLKSILFENGASLVGFANLKSMVTSDMPFGVSVVVALPVDMVKSIHDGPNMEYYDQYYELNDKLDSLVTIADEFLKNEGYKAYAQTVKAEEEFGIYRTALPHKTVATNAGLGWIGKSALLVIVWFAQMRVQARQYQVNCGVQN